MDSKHESVLTQYKVSVTVEPNGMDSTSMFAIQTVIEHVAWTLHNEKKIGY